MSVAADKIQNLAKINEKDRIEITRRIIHNDEVSTARVIHAHQTAELKKRKALATVKSAMAVARGFENQVSIMNS